MQPDQNNNMTQQINPLPDTTALPDFVPMDQLSQHLPSLYSDPATIFQHLPDFIPASQIGTFATYIHALSPGFGQLQGQTSSDPIQNMLSTSGSKAFGPNEVPALLQIVKKESGFNPQAANPTSSARGLFQFLSSTGKEYGLPSDASQAPTEAQIAAGIQYIKSRYGSPSKALQFHNEKGWY